MRQTQRHVLNCFHSHPLTLLTLLTPPPQLPRSSLSSSVSVAAVRFFQDRVEDEEKVRCVALASPRSCKFVCGLRLFMFIYVTLVLRSLMGLFGEEYRL